MSLDRPPCPAWAWGISAPSSASPIAIERSTSVRRSMFGPSPVGPATTASADFCRPVPSPSGAGSTPVAGRQDDGPPRVRHVTFGPSTCRIYGRPFRVISGFGSACSLAQARPPHMRLLFVRPALCLQLPSDPASRRRPCCSASGSHHQGPQRTFTSWSPAGYHSGQTALSRPVPCLAHTPKAPPFWGGALDQISMCIEL